MDKNNFWSKNDSWKQNPKKQGKSEKKWRR
jgi:hypothetical protein